MKKVDNKIRFILSDVESPSITNLQLQSSRQANVASLSPMTDLAFNLSDTTLANSPAINLMSKRRLSLSDGTPKQSSFVPPDFMDTMSMDGMGENRLLKNAIKFPGSLGKDSASFSRTRGFLQRINLSPATHNENNILALNNKENNDSDMLPITAIVSPEKIVNSPSKFAMMRKQSSPLRQRQPLEDHDPNSQDSGYGISFSDKVDLKTGFRFAEPFGLAPRRHHTDQSPIKENTSLSPRCKTVSQIPKLFLSLSSGSGSGGESLDDSFLEMFDIDKFEDEENLPSGLNSLLSKPIFKDETAATKQPTTLHDDKPRPRVARSFSLNDNLTPNSSRARSCLFKPASSPTSHDVDMETARPFKRPDPPTDYVSPSQAKRRKSSSLHSICENPTVELKATSHGMKKPHVLKRCFSETEATIMKALHRSSQEPDLIGDFTKPYTLPLIEGRHQDLKTITANTLAELMDGRFVDSVDTFTVVDCRYPYEYTGGHIRGARNIYTKEQVLRDLVEVKQSEAKSEQSGAVKRKHIMVFHCEFSSERGPSLYRFLRNCDRDQNKECYPALYYPELYLLDGGYKNFYTQYSGMCEPQAYRPMLDPSHEVDLRHFRAKSKSWNGDSKSRLALRNNLKRLGL